MLIQAVSGICERRIILNWRVDPALVAKHLPRPFRPRLVKGHAIVSVEVLQLVGMRPTGMPRIAGFHTQNAVDRIAVEWNEGGSILHGFFVPSRYSPSAVNTLISLTRLFPAVFKHARFRFERAGVHYRVSVAAEGNRLSFDANESSIFSEKSAFDSMNMASEFHRDAKISYSPAHEEGTYDGIYLKSFDWHATPLEVINVHYDYIEKTFPGAVFDSAFVVRNTKHEWHGMGSIKNAVKEVGKEKAHVSAPAEKPTAAAKPATKEVVKKASAKAAANKGPAKTSKKQTATHKKSTAKSKTASKSKTTAKTKPAAKTTASKKPSTKKPTAKKRS